MERVGPVRGALAPLISQGSVAVCTPVLLESMYSARAKDYERGLAFYRDAVSTLPLTPESCERAVEVQRLLAQTAQHRTAKVVDLLTAACAEVNKLTLLHYDKDYDAIAGVTGQPTMWVVPAGSVP
jgi:predicted nucleic acid-binding protein